MHLKCLRSDLFLHKKSHTADAHFVLNYKLQTFFLPARHTELPLLSGAEDLAGTVSKEPPGNPISVSRLMLLMYIGRLLIPTPAASLETQRIVNMVRESSWTLLCMNAKYLEHWYGSGDSLAFVSIHVPLHNILMIKNQILPSDMPADSSEVSQLLPNAEFKPEFCKNKVIKNPRPPNL